MFVQDTFTPLDFWENHTNNGECWEWKGYKQYAKNSKIAYGYVYYKPLARSVAVHRLAWALTHKQHIPDKMVIMHRCDNSLCYNPAHLTIGTQRDNIYDMIKKGRDNNFDGSPGRKTLVTHCIHGHAYTPENTRIIRYKSGKLQRKCKQCKLQENRRYRLKNKNML